MDAEKNTMKKQLLQLHWQFKDGHTEMRAQNEFKFERWKTNKEFVEWLKEIQKTHPLPDGADWMVCNEKSEYFVGVPI